MFKKYGLGIVAMIIAVAAVAFTRPAKAVKHAGPSTSFYFKYTGTHGSEATASLWTELANVTAYNNEPCASTVTGCKLITTSVTGTAPNRHPSTVYVNGSSSPINMNEVSGVINKP